MMAETYVEAPTACSIVGINKITGQLQYLPDGGSESGGILIICDLEREETHISAATKGQTITYEVIIHRV
jgi:hypothetical protein